LRSWEFELKSRFWFNIIIGENSANQRSADSERKGRLGGDIEIAKEDRTDGEGSLKEASDYGKRQVARFQEIRKETKRRRQ
jgi:hypothetical protein